MYYDQIISYHFIGILAIVLLMNVFHISVPITTRTASGEFAVTGEGKVDMGMGGPECIASLQGIDKPRKLLL